MRCFVKRLARCTAAIALVCATAPVLAQCPPDGWTVATLSQLKSEKWTLPDPAQRQTLALGLLACLDQADPVLRDGLAFEAFSTLLRNRQLTPATQRAIYRSQIDRLSPSAVDPSGFAKPFAALVLSEVTRADRLMVFLSQEERIALLDAGARYMDAIDDYRGFSSTQGWRHAVAHSADLMLQIALHPATDKAQLERIALTVQRKVAPPGEHFYVYGEPDRLVRPIVYAARRGLLDGAFWSAYIQTLAAPAPMESWDQAFNSQSGLARLHNVKSFLRALDASVRTSGDTLVQETFTTPLQLALKELP